MPDPAFVQSVYADAIPAAFSGDNVDHDLLVVVVFNDTAIGTADSFTCEDSQGNVYVPLPFRTNNDDVTPLRSQTFYCLGCKPGANTVTGAAFKTVALEFSGVDTYGESAAAFGVGLAQDSGNITTTKSLALLFGLELAFAGSGAQASAAVGAGWSLAQNAGSYGLAQYKVVSSAGNYASTSTATTGKGGSVKWIEEIDSFYGPQPPAIETVQIIEMQ